MNRRRGKPYSKAQLARAARKQRIWATVAERGWYSSRFAFELAWMLGDFRSWENDEAARAEFQWRNRRETGMFR